MGEEGKGGGGCYSDRDVHVITWIRGGKYKGNDKDKGIVGRGGGGGVIRRGYMERILTS